MKAGDFITTRSILERGYKFFCYFAGYHVYKIVEDESITYIFHDFLKQEIVSTLKSTQ